MRKASEMLPFAGVTGVASADEYGISGLFLRGRYRGLTRFIQSYNRPHRTCGLLYAVISFRCPGDPGGCGPGRCTG